jgi:predicted adenylyl cyclase CyaB
MMKEIEVKILDVDRDAVVKKLLLLGAKKIHEGEFYSIYLDFADGSLQKEGKILRLRKEGEKSVIALKEFISDKGAKQRAEHEVVVDDFKKAKHILHLLGLKVKLVMRKHRVSYLLGKFKVEFDKYKGDYSFIPEFLEIEGPSVDKIYDLAKKLGYSKSDCKPWTAKKLAEYYS